MLGRAAALPQALGPAAGGRAGLLNGFEGCSSGNRRDDILPGKTGRWGLGTRWRATDETEVGLYYPNYHDRTPVPEINAFTPGTVTLGFFNVPGNQIGNGSYRVRYFDDVKPIGATFSTTFNIVTVAGEISPQGRRAGAGEYAGQPAGAQQPVELHPQSDARQGHAVQHQRLLGPRPQRRLRIRRS